MGSESRSIFVGLVFLGACVFCASGRPSTQDGGGWSHEPLASDTSPGGSGGVGGGGGGGGGWTSDFKFFQFFRQIYSECFAGNVDIVVCLKQRAVHVLDQALKVQSIPLIDGFSLTKTVNDSSLMRDESEDLMLNTLPRDLDKKDKMLDKMIAKKLENFFAARSITVDTNSNEVDGRKKKEKELHHYLMMAAATAAAILGPLAFKSLAIIATKALVVSKIAIVIASIVAIKKLFSHPHQESEVVSHHYGRSLQHISGRKDASEIAYNAHHPNKYGKKSGTEIEGGRSIMTGLEALPLEASAAAVLGLTLLEILWWVQFKSQEPRIQSVLDGIPQHMIEDHQMPA